MGLSIYYSGQLRDPNLIDDIISEAADIAGSMQWNISELPSAPGIPVRGLIIQPENCTPLWLTFHASGKLCNPILFSFLIEREDPKAIVEAKEVLVTEMQNGGPITHMAVIKFFRYLSEKYFSHFELNDDSKFWETSDEQLCHKRFGESGRVANLLDIALASMDVNAGKKEKKYGWLRRRLKGVRKGEA